MKTNVIVPVKDHNDFLGTQTKQDEEDIKFIFVVDESSNEYTINRAKKLNEIYPNKKIDVHFVNYKNINKSLNFGLSKIDSDAKYISVMEDDFHYPFKITEQVSFLEKNPDIGILGSNHYAVAINEGMRHEIHEYKETHNEIICRYFFDIAMCGPMFTVKREIFNYTDFGEEDMWCYHLVNGTKRHFKLHNYQKKLSCYYRYSSSNSVSKEPVFNNFIINSLQNNINMLNIYDINANDFFKELRLLTTTTDTLDKLKKINDANNKWNVFPKTEFETEIEYRVAYVKHYLKNKEHSK